MKSRKSFIQNCTLGSLALVVTKPYKSFSNIISNTTGITDDRNLKVTFLITHGKNTSFSSLKSKIKNNITINTSTLANANYCDINFKKSEALDSKTCHFEIIEKGNFKIGILFLQSSRSINIREVSKTASYLKEAEGCHFVICLSKLGFQNNVVIDDKKLAKLTANIDMIVCCNTTNSCTQSTILYNVNKDEVFAIPSINKSFGLTSVEIEFDTNKKKKKVTFNSILDRIEN